MTCDAKQWLVAMLLAVAAGCAADGGGSAAGSSSVVSQTTDPVRTTSVAKLDLGSGPDHPACLDDPGAGCVATNADRLDSRAAGRPALSFELVVAPDSCMGARQIGARLLALSPSTDEVAGYNTRYAGQNRVSVSLYGRDADAMWHVAEPVLRSAHLEERSFVVARKGGPGSTEERKDLSAFVRSNSAGCAAP